MYITFCLRVVDIAIDVASLAQEKLLTVVSEVPHVGVPKEFYSGTPSVPRFHYIWPYT